MPMNVNTFIICTGLAISTLAFLRFVHTFAPSLIIELDDSAEFYVMAKYPGITHPTGYPLFVWLLHLASLLPLGDLVFRVNFLCAAAGAGFCLYLIVSQLIQEDALGRAWGAGVAALSLTTSYTFWHVSIVAAPYSLHMLLFLLLTICLMRWSKLGNNTVLIAGAFLYGAMFGNHMTSIAIGPAIILFIASHYPKRRISFKLFGIILASCACGFLIFNVGLMFLLWQRHLPFDYYHSVMLTVGDDWREPISDSFWSAWSFTVRGVQFAKHMGTPITWKIEQLHLLIPRITAHECTGICGLGSNVRS
jgi:hypothetical protein